MRNSILLSSLAAALTFASVGCDVEKTRDGEMPTVDVDPGQAPAYDVDMPDVDMSMEESTVEVPDIDVEMEEKKVTTPDLDITLPEDN